ncbi:hypothetical protein FJZ27_03685 [Candidatus Peribacteria bacterium]|nr:hypothetical protein [Candidatus Peribacteria bacterium]
MSNAESTLRRAESPSETLLHQTETLENISESVLSFDRIDAPNASDIGGKAAHLVMLKKAGLPVPSGYCVPISAHQQFLEHGKIPERLIEDITEAKRVLGGKIALRSSATCEDDSQLSMAGVFESLYLYDDRQIASGIEQIFQQARSRDVESFMALHGKSAGDVQMALVIQRLIEPELSGVIYTRVNGDKLLIQYIDGFGALLVDGTTRGSALIVDASGRIVESTGFEMRPFPRKAVVQVQHCTRVIEILFPDAAQDIEFTFRDGVVSIVQARPLTTDLGKVELRETPVECLEAHTKEKIRRLMAREKAELGTKTAVFSDANYSELLPKPTEMDVGLHMYVWGGSNGIPGAKQIGHSKMGYQVGPGAVPIISYLGGRPYSSIARYAAIYHAGFPETKEEYFSTLVNEYLEAIQTNPEKGAYPQMGLFLQDPTLEDLQARFGDRAEEYFRVYQEFTVRMRGFARDFITEFREKRLFSNAAFAETMGQADLEGMSCQQLLGHATAILEHIRTESNVDFVKAARLGFYYSQRLQGLLVQKLGHGREQAKKIFSKLNQGLDGSAITDANVAIAEAASDEEAMKIAPFLIGHFSTGEMLEIRHKRLRDDPEALRTYVTGIRQTGNYKQQFETQKAARLEAEGSLLTGLPEDDRIELREVIRASQTYMALRETVKYLFTKEYLLLRDALEVLGQKTNLENGDIYFLYPRELASLVADPSSMLHLIRARRQSFKNYEELAMPSVIRESDVDGISLASDSDVDFTEAAGKFLAEGPLVEGTIVNLDECENLDQAAALMRQYQALNVSVVLVATQMNLSHDPFIAQSAGLVIENAGIVAHGAQRARELGKGAIGGIKSKQLKTGMRVFFDPLKQIIRKLS